MQTLQAVRRVHEGFHACGSTPCGPEWTDAVITATEAEMGGKGFDVVNAGTPECARSTKGSTGLCQIYDLCPVVNEPCRTPESVECYDTTERCHCSSIDQPEVLPLPVWAVTQVSQRCRMHTVK